MKLRPARALVCTAVVLLAGIGLPAEADLIVNGGFETGNFTGWLQTGDTGFSGVDALAARSGSFGAFFGPTSPGGISQSIATTAGTTYKVDFSLALSDSAQPNSFAWSWNGLTQVPTLSNAPAFGYTDFSGLVIATGASSTLALTFSNPQSFWLLDNVAVNAIAVNGVSIPEPATYGLILVGLVVVGWMRPRRKV